jgi:TRAP-type C4-dicarboxylate transport system permease small subunit
MKKFYDYICKIEVFLVQIFLVLITILVFSAGISRMIHRPIGWANPLASFLFAWTAFFATDAAFRENKLMSVDFLVKKFPQKIRKYINILNYVIIAIFCIYLIIYGIRVAYFMRFRMFEGIYGFSYMWVTFSIPIGGFLILITTILKIIEEIRRS